MKNKFLIIIALFVMFLPVFSYSQGAYGNGGGGSSSDTPIDCGSSTIRAGNSSIDLVCQVCDFRKMFCGGVAVALITVTVIFVGLLTLMNKINWGFILVMAGAAIIFVNADKVSYVVTGENVQCSC
jgi:type IV secretory pathway VirB2 component (pilin)